MTTTLPARGVALILAALMAGFIVYGSLYPFRFRPLPDGIRLAEAAWAALFRRAGGRGDLAANLVLYAPLGFALAAAVRLRPAAAIPLATLACALLSAAMELSQLHIPGRAATGLDLLLNTIGGGLGAAAGIALVARHGPGRGPGREPGPPLRPAAPFAALLLACWLGYRLYPYVPALDLGEWRASLAPLLRDPPDLGRALRLAVLWLVAARLLAAAWPRAGGVLPVAALLAAVLAAAVPIVDRRLTPDEVLAAVLALAAWAPLRGRRPLASWTDPVLLVLLFGAVLAEGLAPYRLAVEARPFGWMPFRSVMRGSWGNGLQAMLLKSYLYGALVWLAVGAGFRLSLAGPATVLLALAISLAQTWLPGRSADTTDATLAALAVLTLWLLPRGGPHVLPRGEPHVLPRGRPRCEVSPR